MKDVPEAEQNPWTTTGSRPIYANPWLKLREDQVINPSGGQGSYGVVEFSNLAVGVIPVDDQEHTWLVGQYRYPLGHYSWEIPMGGHPKDQDPRQGAYRELAEETGLRAERLELIAEVELSNSVTDERGLVYLARGLTQGDTAFDETEQLQLRRLPLEEAIAWALDGRIRDALSVIGLLKVHALQQGTDWEC